MNEPLIEVMIPAFNEVEHIAEAVRNALQVGPVFVLDSCSTDGTQEQARGAGATVLEHKFEGYALQKNWGLKNLPFRGRWIFILDADERFTPKLIQELQQIASSESAIAGYYVNRKLIIMGRVIRHGGLYPSWNLRFFRRGRAWYEERLVHEHMVCYGPKEYLKHPMIHIRSETMTQYIAKHIRYADMESDEWISRRLGRGGGAEASELFRASLRYRQWLRRNIWPAIPCRPIWRFAYMYFFKLGFLDGRAGWHLAMLMASYEYMIGLLYREKFAAISQQRNNARKGPSTLA